VQILHDWSDKKAGEILRAVRKAIGTAAAKIVIVEVRAPSSLPLSAKSSVSASSSSNTTSFHFYRFHLSSSRQMSALAGFVPHHNPLVAASGRLRCVAAIFSS
jgi:hypothetical protein